MGIADLTPEARGLTIEDVLDGLNDELKERLIDALSTRRPGSRNYVFAERQITEACAEDGYILMPRAVRHWRDKLNGH